MKTTGLRIPIRAFVLFLFVSALGADSAIGAASLRFYGNGSGDIDRVKIPIDDPSNSNPGPPADVGATDFTIEFWMKAVAADNPTPSVPCGANQNWKNGNLIVDRDRLGQDRKFGVSVAAGKIVFGVSGDGTGDRTICGSRSVLDDVWHHVAVERRLSDGHLWIFVDGVLEAEGDGPNGDVSYPDDATPADPNDPFLVIGAEKFDTGSPYGGTIDELRISTVLRYTAAFTRPNTAFAADANTAALYHFDEAAGAVAADSSGAAGGPSDGNLAVGGSPSGPEWSSTVAPLGGNPSIALTLLTQAVSAPVHVTHAPDGSGRLFIVEKGGYIRIFKNGGLLPTPFLDIHTLVSNDSEQGLLSVTFHPDYAANGTFFVYYTDNIASPGDITLARYQVSADPDVADPASAQIVLVVPHPVNANHNGGQLFFGPDGFLYMGTGDGGGGGDVPNNAQNKDILLGKILRLDIDGSGAVPCGQTTAMPYGIPNSNPFVGQAGCDEIWAYGVRNPWRFSFDQANGDLLIGDVGQNAWEEVDYQLSSSAGGENYGWHKMEGNHCYNPPNNCDDGTLVHPVLEYDHSAGRCSITGGYRYRGTAIPGLNGIYLFADFCGGQIYAGKQDAAGAWTSSLLLDTAVNVSSFGEDDTGEVYVCGLGGVVYRIDPVPYPAPALTSVFPTAVIASDPGFTLQVNGSGFVYPSVVRWNGANRPTTFVSANQLQAQIPATDILSAGTAQVTVFTPTPGGGTSSPRTVNINETFLDVPVSHFAYQYIQAVYNAGVTAGCAFRLYCPDNPTTRAQMAVFLLKASQGSSYTPPPCTGNLFGDVTCSSNFDPWIEDLAGRGITGGCQANPPLYCPTASVTRAQMAPFLLKTLEGSTYVPPDCTGTVFDDVPCTGGIFDSWIEDLAGLGITGGCQANPPLYCPSNPVTRAQMAIFLTLTFSIPIP